MISLPIKENVSLEKVVEFLNDALEKDRTAISKLVNDRVDCNDELAEHDTIQVKCYEGEQSVGLLGLINGLFGKNEKGWGYLSALIDEDTGKVDEFRLLTEEDIKQFEEGEY